MAGCLGEESASDLTDDDDDDYDYDPDVLH